MRRKAHLNFGNFEEFAPPINRLGILGTFELGTLQHISRSGELTHPLLSSF